MQITLSEIEELYVKPVREAWRTDHAELEKALEIAVDENMKLRSEITGTSNDHL